MWFPEMVYTIDILFVAFVLFFAIRGVWNGLSGELAHVVTLAVLLGGLCFFYPQMRDLLSDLWSSLPENAVRVVVIGALILASVLLFFLLRVLFKQLLKSKMGEASDKIAGALVGMLRGILLGLALLSGLSLIPNESLYRALSEKSAVGGWVCNTLTPWAQPKLGELPVLKDRVSEQIEELTQ